MSLLDALRHRAHVLLHPGEHARDLEEEFQFHLSLDAMQQARITGQPTADEEARYAAKRRFGNLAMLAEETRRMAGLGFLDVVAQDARFALRSFRRTPGFTAVAVLTLAIGIGANTAIFSAVNALLLRPLPFAHPERLMSVSLTVPATRQGPARDDMVWSYPKYATFRDAQHVFSSMALYTRDKFTLTGGSDAAERDDGEYASAAYLPTLGITPALGRNFTADEDAHPDGPRVVILGDALWRRRFSADPHVLGTTVNLGGQPFTIIGVLPPGFRGLSGHGDLLVPVMSQPADELNEAWSHAYGLVARLAPGATIEKAEAVTRQLGARVDEAWPDPVVHTQHWGAVARPLDARRVAPVIRTSLLVLLGAVGLVLLIACANVANLFLVRAAGRRREIAVRLAIGAGRGRLIRQLITESLMLALLGAAASLLVAWWGVSALSSLNLVQALQADSGIGAVTFASIHLDGRAFAFTALLAVGTGVLFGLVPALQATHPSLTNALKEGGDAQPSRLRGLSSRNILAVVEVALALVLLSGSGLMLRSLRELLQVNPGIDPAHVLTVSLSAGSTVGGDSLPGFYDQALDRLRGLPGVRGAALTDCPPLNGGCNLTLISLRDREPATAGGEPVIGVHWISPDWPSVMHVPLMRGRAFTTSDRQGTPKVVVINQTAARTFWPGEDPIGKPLNLGQGGFDKDTARVIGVVGDVRYETLDTPPRPDVYLSYYQSPRGRMMLFVRTEGDPLALAPVVRSAMHDIAPQVPLYDIKPMDMRVTDATSTQRFSGIILTLFAAVALALAALGIYGVISYAVGQRTHEIGVRMALGATRREVASLVLRQGAGIAIAGGVIGISAALMSTRVLRSLLYEVAPSDPLTYVGIAVLLACTVLLASWIPARRATRVNPMTALRTE